MEEHGELIGLLRRESYTFRTLEKNHSELEARLHDLNRRKVLSVEEEMDKKRLQKQKLAAKDTMKQMMQHYELTGKIEASQG